MTGDTQTKSDAARATAQRMIESDGAVMVSGGSSSGSAIAMQALCQEAGVMFMAALSHSNDATGRDRRRNGFRHHLNSEMSARALAWGLRYSYGNERSAYFLTADYTWGWSTEAAVIEHTEAMGWRTVASIRTPLGAGDFSSYITPVINSGADVLVLTHYGSDLVNSFTQATQFALLDRVVGGRDFQIAAPFVSRLMAQAMGATSRDLFSTTNWRWTQQDDGSRAFVRSFGQAYGFPPSASAHTASAHTAYVQTLLYADACERAGTFDPCGVAAALEDFRFDGLGDGPSLYRSEDHQCFKRVPIIAGRISPTTQFDLTTIVDFAPLEAVTYPVEHPAFEGGALGACQSPSTPNPAPL